MARIKKEDRECAQMVSLSCLPVPNGKCAVEMYGSAVKLADKRAFPVNMRIAIGQLSLNDAAKIGYLRGMHDAAISIKSERKI